MDFANQPTKGTDKDGEGGDEDINPKTGAKVRRQNSIKHTCPECGAIVRATKELNIECGDCKVAANPVTDIFITLRPSTLNLTPKRRQSLPL